MCLKSGVRASTEVATPDSAKTRKLISEEMERVLRSREFSASERSCTFLRYLVERALDGSGHQLKERTIGVDVFGRDATYDTGKDAIVRVSANGVRKRLLAHYAKADLAREPGSVRDLPAGRQLYARVPHLAAGAGRNGATRGAGQPPIAAEFGAGAKVEVARCRLGGDRGSCRGLRPAGVVQPPTGEPGSAGAGDGDAAMVAIWIAEGGAGSAHRRELHDLFQRRRQTGTYAR